MVFERGVERVHRDEEHWLVGRLASPGEHLGYMWCGGRIDMEWLEGKVRGMGLLQME